MSITRIREAFRDGLATDFPDRTVTSDLPERVDPDSTVLVRVSQETVRQGDISPDGPLTMDATIVVSIAESKHSKAEAMIDKAVAAFHRLRADGDFPEAITGNYTGFTAGENTEGIVPIRFYNATFNIAYNRGT